MTFFEAMKHKYWQLPAWGNRWFGWIETYGHSKIVEFEYVGEKMSITNHFPSIFREHFEYDNYIIKD